MGNKPPSFKDNTSIESQYFSLITTILSNLQSNHFNNPINTQICLEKRSFEKTSAVRVSIIPDTKVKPLYWKDYLLSYFQKRKKEKIYWYEDIINDINSTSFINESNYLSHFFYKEFERKTKPPFLKDISSPSLTNTNNNYNLIESPDLEENVVRKIKMNKIAYGNLSYLEKSNFMNTSQNKVNLLNVTDNYAGSFISSSFDKSFTSSNEANYNYKHMRRHIRDIISLLKQDLSNSEHPITKVIHIFETQLSYVVQSQLEILDAEEKEGEDVYQTYKDLFNEIEYHIKKFIIKIQTALKLFYAPVIDFDCFREERDETINLMTSILFNTGDIYEKVYKLLGIILKKDILMFDAKLKELQNISPAKIGVSERLRLNNETKELMKKMKEENINMNNSINNDTNSNNNDKKAKAAGTMDDILNFKMENDNNGLGSGRVTVSETKIHLKKEFQKDSVYFAYDTAVKLFKNIKFNKKPFEKLLILASIGNELTDCVNHFWKGMQNYIPQNYLSLNSDDLLVLFIYILIQAQTPEIILHKFIMETFISNNTKSTMVGYYLTTLQAAIDFLLEGNIKP